MGGQDSRKKKAGEGRPWELVISGGTVYDGTGAEPVVIDLAVGKGRIAALGRDLGPAEKTIDAQGLMVCPGFIDVHTHCDQTFSGLESDPGLDPETLDPAWLENRNYLLQGVTTVVSGNCGEGATRVGRFLDFMAGLEYGTNLAHLAPHGDIRQELFGPDQPRELSQSRLQALQEKMVQALEEGAVGFSSGLEYAPGFLSTTRELTELARTAAKAGGLYASHIRNETGRAQSWSRGKPGLLASLEEAIEIGRRAGIRVQVSHLKLNQPFEGLTMEPALELIDGARQEGLAVSADQYPYPASATILTVRLPKEMIGAGGKVKEKYRASTGRAEIRRAIRAEFRNLGPEMILITRHGREPELEGKNLQEIAELKGVSPEEAFIGLVCDGRPPEAAFFGQELKVVREIMAREYVMTGSDGQTYAPGQARPHPRSYGTFPRKLKRFALEEKVLDLAQAVRSMTGLPAEAFGFKDRGLIRAGAWADLAVIDLGKLHDPAEFTDPHQYAQGVVHLLVNGVEAVEEGRTTGKRAGLVLRHD